MAKTPRIKLRAALLSLSTLFCAMGARAQGEQPQAPKPEQVELEEEPAEKPSEKTTEKPTEKPANEATTEKPANENAPATNLTTAPETDETPVPKPKKKASEQPAARPELALGLSPGAPQTAPPLGSLTPAYGEAPRNRHDFRFDLHGFFTLPLRVGFNERANPTSDQYKAVYHTPPQVPGDFEEFEYTSVMPEPWVQLNFSYGNPNVVGTIIIAARSVSNATAFFEPPTQLGINDAFLTFRLPPFSGVRVDVDVGGFADRYGVMGEYDTGRYNTPLIARLAGVGETVRARAPLGESLELALEHGVMGQLNKAPLGLEPAGWNGFADPNVGTSFAHHAHAALGMPKLGQLALHYINVFSQDDRATPTVQPDGTITVVGADLSLASAPYGHLYLGGAYTKGNDARSVSGVIRVLNAFGGPGLIREYFGPASGGNGSLTTIAAQYDLSIGSLVRHPQPYSGYAPDVLVSAFGMYTKVKSDDDFYDGVSKSKYGAELTYSALSFLALSARYDQVQPDGDDKKQTFSILSPRLILRSDYNAQDQVVIQYSHYFYGSNVIVNGGYPARPDPAIDPDKDVVSLTASMWW